MTKDPYETLGVGREASQDEIRKAYRRLAKEHHPDLHPGDRKAEERFKDVASAFDILGDPDKRARFDRGEIDATGAERPQHHTYRDFADAAAGEKYTSRAGFSDFEDLGDVFSDLFGMRGRARTMRMRGGDVRLEAEVDFLEAVNGATKRVRMPGGETLDLTIPAGLADGQVLRLKGKGMEGIGGGPPGDALVHVHVRPHRLFRRKGNDIHLDLPVSLAEAVLGGKVRTPTPTGPVTLSVPKGANTGSTLRLKGKGVPAGKGRKAGDLYVHLAVTLPETPDAELEGFVRDWADRHPYDPRRAMEA